MYKPTVNKKQFYDFAYEHVLIFFLNLISVKHTKLHFTLYLFFYNIEKATFYFFFT